VIIAAVVLIGTTVALNIIALTKSKQNADLTEWRQENE
jgi:hypothetical protein